MTPTSWTEIQNPENWTKTGLAFGRSRENLVHSRVVNYIFTFI